MSVIWLRVAAGLYSLGLLHAILTLVRRREHLFRVALGAFALGKSGRGESGQPEPRSFAFREEAFRGSGTPKRRRLGN
jgi:hypothetical protein